MGSKTVSEERGQLVVKSNKIIQNVVRYEGLGQGKMGLHAMSLQEQKLLMYIISKIKPKDTEFEQIEFGIQEYCRVCGIEKSGKNYSDIKKTIRLLANRSMWIRTGDTEETLVRWIEKAIVDGKSGKVEMKLDKDMKPFLLLLNDKFTKYQLIYALAMRSQYAVRLYELAKSYAFRAFFEIKMEDLKALLGAENYTRNPDFVRRVLNLSVREINEFTDIKISYTIKSDEKKNKTVRFEIKEVTKTERVRKNSMLEQMLDSKQLSLFEALPESGSESTRAN